MFAPRARAIDQDLAGLDAEVLCVAATVAEDLGVVSEALATGDAALAATVVGAHLELGRPVRSCEERAVQLLARRQPTAGDLRQVVTEVRLVHELERCARLVSHVAVFAAGPHAGLPPDVRSLVARMAAEAHLLFRGALDAYAARDAQQAEALDVWDDRIDELHRHLLDELLSGDLGLETTLHLALVGRFLERIADRAVAIGERVRFLVSGELGAASVDRGAVTGEPSPDDGGDERLEITAAPGRLHFHRRIASLRRTVVAIGHEVQRSIPEATEAWLRRDCAAGRLVDARTAGWSARARDVELASYRLIATQQPMALDLRQLVALLRLSEAVSRSGDLVAHIARSACFEREADAFSASLRSLVVEMATVAARQFGDALATFAAEDGAAGKLVEDADEELDLLRTELLATLVETRARTVPAIDLALLGRFYERLGDHAVDIARSAGFVSSGEVP